MITLTLTLISPSVYTCTVCVYVWCMSGVNVDVSAVAILHWPTAELIHDSSSTGSWTFLYQYVS